MAGIKGRSGRKPLLEEKKVEEILRLSSDVLIRWLSNPEIPDDRKIPVASQLVSRRIPTSVDGESLPQEARIIIIRDENKIETVAKQDGIQQGEIPRPILRLGDGQESVSHLTGNIIQRADPQ